jgi:hypothetical protein
MAFFALDVSHKADAARVMFIGARVQAVFLQIGNLSGRRHGALLEFYRWVARIMQCSNNAKQNNWGQIPIILPGRSD